MAALVNDLGTGSPNLIMRLADNGGTKWKPYDLNYKSQGNVPGGINETNWSAWNVWDQPGGKGNFYGTIVLHSDGNNSIWLGDNPYTPGDNKNRLLDFSLEGIDTGRYRLRVGSVFPSFPVRTPGEASRVSRDATANRAQHPRRKDRERSGRRRCAEGGDASVARMAH